MRDVNRGGIANFHKMKMVARKRKNACKSISSKGEKNPEENKRKLEKCNIKKKLKSVLPKKQKNERRNFSDVNYSKNVFHEKRLSKLIFQ